MKRKLYFCERCSRVYVAEVDNGKCRSWRKSFAGKWITCDGTIRPIDYEPPKKDPLQRDIEYQIANPAVDPGRCPDTTIHFGTTQQCMRDKGHVGAHMGRYRQADIEWTDC